LIDRWLSVKVTPSAGRNEITGWRDGALHLKIAAPPEKGKANKELIDFLGRKLGIKKSAISIIKGQTGRNKVITIEGMNREEIIKRLKI
jgi:uncharacterized protein (TIGR00251 family)